MADGVRGLVDVGPATEAVPSDAQVSLALKASSKVKLTRFVSSFLLSLFERGEPTRMKIVLRLRCLLSDLEMTLISLLAWRKCIGCIISSVVSEILWLRWLILGCVAVTYPTWLRHHYNAELLKK